MAITGDLSRHNHLSEFNSPLPAATGMLSPETRRSLARSNLGLGTTSGGMMLRQPAPAAKTDTVTLTAAELLTGLIVGTPTAAASYTLPLGSALETALLAVFPNLSNDDAFDFNIVNVATNSAFDITVLTAAGWTLTGGMVVESNEATATRGPSGAFRVRRTGSGTYTLYRLA